MTVKEPLKVGEKYLSIQLLGQNGFKVVAFRNKKKENPMHPDFTGNGVAVWILEKKPGIKEEKIEDSSL